MTKEHAGFLSSIAKNLNNKTAIQAYADWLQDQGNPGWYVVAHYPPEHWLVRYKGKQSWDSGYQLPWIAGLSVLVNEGSADWRNRLKKALTAYAKRTT